MFRDTRNTYQLSVMCANVTKNKSYYTFTILNNCNELYYSRSGCLPTVYSMNKLVTFDIGRLINT